MDSDSPHTLPQMDQRMHGIGLSARTDKEDYGLHFLAVAPTASMGSSSLIIPVKMGWWTTLSLRSVKTTGEDCGLGRGMASPALMEVGSSTILNRREQDCGPMA